MGVVCRHGGGQNPRAVPDVEQFESPKTSTDLGMRMAIGVRIRYVPGFKRSPLDVALGSIGFGSAQTRLMRTA
jgi:hypothetical protein